MGSGPVRCPACNALSNPLWCSHCGARLPLRTGSGSWRWRAVRNLALLVPLTVLCLEAPRIFWLLVTLAVPIVFLMRLPPSLDEQEFLLVQPHRAPEPQADPIPFRSLSKAAPHDLRAIHDLAQAVKRENAARLRECPPPQKRVKPRRYCVPVRPVASRPDREKRWPSDDRSDW